MLVQHAGLNPMGRKARAGCPINNLQPTLDGLTAAGLTVAVYEEIAPASTKGKLKYRRALTQVVSPASPVYMYEACLSPHQISYRGEPPPYAGVTASASGYSVVFVHVDSRTWRVHQRLSEPALKALLTARPHAPPLLVNGGDDFKQLGSLAAERRNLKAPNPNAFPKALLRHVANECELSSTTSSSSRRATRAASMTRAADAIIRADRHPGRPAPDRRHTGPPSALLPTTRRPHANTAALAAAAAAAVRRGRGAPHASS